MSSTEADLVEQAPNEKKRTTPEKYGLDAMFAPSSVAVIGATSRPGTVGRTVLENLLRGSFQGKVYAVNAKHEEVLGLKAYKSIRDIPHPVDLAVVATPAATVPQIIAECVGCRRQIRGSDFCWIQGTRRGRRCTRTADSRAVATRFHALDWPKLPGHHEPDDRVECHLRQRCAEGGQRRVPESKRSAFDRDPRLEPARRSRLQRDRFDRFDAGCRLGRSDLPLRRRPAHQEHPALHGIGGRCAVVLCPRLAKSHSPSRSS